MNLKTERLVITEFTTDMAEAVCRNSQDEDNRRFVPDEVFETVKKAEEMITYFQSQYDGEEGPFVYPILTREGDNIGYVQLVAIKEGWELGFHIAKAYTGRGYATEAVRAFLPDICHERKLKQIYGICLEDNRASERVMKKCGFELLFTGEGLYQGEKRRIIKMLWNA